MRLVGDGRGDPSRRGRGDVERIWGNGDVERIYGNGDVEAPGNGTCSETTS